MNHILNQICIEWFYDHLKIISFGENVNEWDTKSIWLHAFMILSSFTRNEWVKDDVWTLLEFNEHYIVLRHELLQ